MDNDTRRLTTLLWALADRKLSTADAVQLDALLQTAQARRVYIQFMDLTAQLRWQHSADWEEKALARLSRGGAAGFPQAMPAGTNAAPLSDCAQCSSVEENSPDPESSRRGGASAGHASAPTRSPVLGFLTGAWQGAYGSPRTLMTIVGAVLSGYFLVMFALIPLARWTEQTRAVDQSSAPTELSRAKPTASIGSLAVDDDARFSKQPAETTVVLGKRYELTAGRVEIVLARGTRIVIEGPAFWQFVSDQQLELHAGRVAAQVPRAAVGFTVNTPTASIVDLGTEFAVDVDGAGATNLSVMYGTVELSKREPAAEQPRRTQASVRVSAGQGMKISRLGSGTVTAQVADIDASWAKRVLSRKAMSRTTLLQQSLVDLPAGKRVAAFQTDAGAAGNQGYFRGGLGLDFDVNDPIRVFSLGVFDHLGDGIEPESALTVQLWMRETGQFKNPEYLSGGHVVAELTFSADSGGELLAGFRYKPLDKPIELLPGKYTVVAYGFSERNPNFNDHCKVEDDPHVKLDSSNSVLSAVQSRFTFAGPGTYPEVFQAASLCYAAGSFEYAPLELEASSQSSPYALSAFLTAAKSPDVLKSFLEEDDSDVRTWSRQCRDFV